jgi:uncharacterized protein (DUF924 family)
MQGDDYRASVDHQMFLYLPFMQTEAMLAQPGLPVLYQIMAARAEPEFAMRELIDGTLS